MKQTLPSAFNALVSKITTFKKSGALLVMLLLISGSVVGHTTLISANFETSNSSVPQNNCKVVLNRLTRNVLMKMYDAQVNKKFYTNFFT